MTVGKGLGKTEQGGGTLESKFAISAAMFNQQWCAMQVYIMRHGEAAESSGCDSLRPLTHCGSDEVSQMGSLLNHKQPKIEALIVSPYLRALQTQKILTPLFATLAEPTILSDLAPSGDAEKVSDYLHALALSGIQSVLVVSHLPLVGYLVANLCPDEAPPMFATAGIAHIEYDPLSAKGQLLSQLSPTRLAKAI